VPFRLFVAAGGAGEDGRRAGHGWCGTVGGVADGFAPLAVVARGLVNGNGALTRGTGCRGTRKTSRTGRRSRSARRSAAYRRKTSRQRAVGPGSRRFAARCRTSRTGRRAPGRPAHDLDVLHREVEFAGSPAAPAERRIAHGRADRCDVLRAMSAERRTAGRAATECDVLRPPAPSRMPPTTEPPSMPPLTFPHADADNPARADRHRQPNPQCRR
jgi:hypothetical protein